MIVNGKEVSGATVALTLFLATQFIGVFAWGVRTDVRVSQLEKTIDEKQIPDRVIKIEKDIEQIKDKQDELKQEQKESTQKILEAIKDSKRNGAR